MKKKYILLILFIFLSFAFGVYTLIIKKEKLSNQNQIILNENDHSTIKDKNVIKDSISQDSTTSKREKNNVIVNENVNEINFRFFDESTGIAVIPETVEIIKKGTRKTNNSILSAQVAHNGTASIQLSNGTYDIMVNAKGYQSMVTYFNLNYQSINIDFNLVPINKPQELSISHITSLHQSDAMVIVGFVVDGDSGQPLESVEITTGDKIDKIYTNKDGYFQLIIPLADDEQLAELRGTVYFNLKNFITEERENFDMWPNGDYIFKIRMMKGSGLNKVKILQNRKASRVILGKDNKPLN